jgi:tetratricopeptide (TPR) repeat protein
VTGAPGDPAESAAAEAGAPAGPPGRPRPVSDADREAFDALVRDSATAVRSMAAAWRTGLTALVTLVTTGVILKGRTDTTDLPFRWRIAVTLAIGAGLALAALGLWQALAAEAGARTRLHTLDDIRARHASVQAYQAGQAAAAGRRLQAARNLVAVALGLLLAGVLLTWWAPAASSYLRVGRPGITNCGTVYSIRDGTLRLTVAGMNQPVTIPLATVTSLTIAASCPLPEGPARSAVDSSRAEGRAHARPVTIPAACPQPGGAAWPAPGPGSRVFLIAQTASARDSILAQSRKARSGWRSPPASTIGSRARRLPPAPLAPGCGKGRRIAGGRIGRVTMRPRPASLQLSRLSVQKARAGRTVTRTPAEQAIWAAAAAGDADAMARVGALLYDRGENSDAEKWWGKAAEAGSASAMHYLGIAYYARRDLSAAEEWWRKAASLGNAEAMYNLGALLDQEGRRPEAEKWFRGAAGAGDVQAMYNLGSLLSERGETTEAIGWLRRAADSGYTKAMHGLGVLLHRQGDKEEGDRWLFLSGPTPTKEELERAIRKHGSPGS